MTELQIAHGMVGAEEAFCELAEQTYEQFLAWVSVQPDFPELYSDLEVVNNVLGAGVSLQQVSVFEKQVARDAARRLAEAAQRSDLLYGWALVRLFDNLADAWALELGG
jgi:hypothetical protein